MNYSLKLQLHAEVHRLKALILCFLLQKTMNRLIKRYILKAQRDKENDQVNEGEFSGGPGAVTRLDHSIIKPPLHLLSPPAAPGELKEIKQDIASLRCELLERGKHDKEALARLVRQLGKVVHNQQKREQKNQLENLGQVELFEGPS